jgi:hypothetical protein
MLIKPVSIFYLKNYKILIIFQQILCESIDLEEFYILSFNSKTIRRSVRSLIVKNWSRASAILRNFRKLCEFQPNASLNLIGLKRIKIKRSKSYRLMCKIINFDCERNLPKFGNRGSIFSKYSKIQHTDLSNFLGRFRQNLNWNKFD